MLRVNDLARPVPLLEPPEMPIAGIVIDDVGRPYFPRRRRFLEQGVGTLLDLVGGQLLAVLVVRCGVEQVVVLGALLRGRLR